MIYEALPTGRQYAITVQQLSDALGIPERDLRRAINKERLAGKPICAAVSAPYGLYKPGDVEEFGEYAKSFQRRTNEMNKVNRALQDQYDEMTGQMSMKMEDLQ